MLENTVLDRSLSQAHAKEEQDINLYPHDITIMANLQRIQVKITYEGKVLLGLC